MPRYFFNILEAGERIEDREGVVLRDDVDAHVFAMISARGIAAEMVRTGQPVPTGIIEIADEQKRSVGRVGYQDAITLE